MHCGVTMFATDYAIRPDDLAREAEARGFESVWFPEHTHIPTSRRSPWPGGPELPKEYWHAHDLFVALSMAAAVTKRIKLASGICLLVERDPITTAKEVASLDFLSKGRVIFGIGGGWNAEEMENHGTNFNHRWKLLRERVEAMKKIWSEDEAAYHGELVNFDPLWSWPKPVQRPHPPILVAGHTSKTLDRVVKYGDGWLPIEARAEDLTKSIEDLRRRAVIAGRDPKTITVTVYGCRPDEEVIRKYKAIGVERVIFGLPAAVRETVLPLMDDYAELARKLG